MEEVEEKQLFVGSPNSSHGNRQRKRAGGSSSQGNPLDAVGMTHGGKPLLMEHGSTWATSQHRSKHSNSPCVGNENYVLD